jgi:formate dehydrogenase subunit gamma
MSATPGPATALSGSPPPRPVHGTLPVDSSFAAETLREVLARHAGEPGALLPILHDLQDALGYVPKSLVIDIAAALNLSRAEVHGVVTYYHHFRDEPPARHVVQICRAEACQAMGGEVLLPHARQHLECDAHGRSKDGSCSVEAAFCLGLCASSPSLLLDDEPHARVTPERFDALLARQRSGT